MNFARPPGAGMLPGFLRFRRQNDKRIKRAGRTWRRGPATVVGTESERKEKSDLRGEYSTIRFFFSDVKGFRIVSDKNVSNNFHLKTPSVFVITKYKSLVFSRL